MNAAICVLHPFARDEIALHLLQLSAEDRRLHFGAPFTDAAIRGYAVTLNFSRDRLLGVFEDGALVGVAHLALQPHGASAQLGISVAPRSRCRGYAYALLCVSVQHARRVACRRLDMHHLAENRIMVHLARKAGLSVIGWTGETAPHIALGVEPAEAALPARPSPWRRGLRSLIPQ